MLTWMTLATGIAVIVAGSLAMMRVDQHWRSSHLQCCRCRRTWFGRDKMCDRGGARGRDYDWLAVKFAGFPTHDWQGYLDTGPIPVVRIPAQRTATHRPDAPGRAPLQERAHALSDGA